MAEPVAKTRFPSRASDYLNLGKPLIGLLAAATCLAGYLSHRPASPAAFFIAAGMFFLAGGAGVLNNCQDRAADGRQRRTADRPLAANRIPVGRAGVLSALLFGLGFGVLWAGSRSAPAIGLGLGCVLIYNGFYTPLKRITPFAFVPGTICGLLCAYLGYVAAGGGVPSRTFVLFLVIVATWQFPHHFLISLIHRDDLLRSDLPSMFRRFTISTLEKWVVLWLLSYAGLTLMLYLLGTVRTDAGMYILLANSFGLMASSTLFLGRRVRNGMYRLLRSQLGFSQVVITLLVITQGGPGPG